MEDMSKIIVFKLKEQEYGLSISDILSIERVMQITQIPQVPHFVKGVVNLRGDIIPIIDLKERLSIGETTHTGDTRILIVEKNNAKMGLLVDSATDVMDLDSSIIEPGPDMINDVNDIYIKGVAKLDEKLILLLDIHNVLAEEEIHAVNAATV
ncbi:chemotaxis protein CheW [Fredinandcohnia humi]